MTKPVLIEARNLTKQFRTREGTVQAVTDVSLTVYKGETLALVGESGCGKSTLGRLLLRLTEPSGGNVLFAGTDILSLNKRTLREFRKKMQIVFQDPYASLNPRMSVGKLLAEPLLNFGDRKAAGPRVIELMNKVGLRSDHYNRFPHQFSGGQRQRIGIARALALNPEFIVCDEPVSALDVSIQAQILNLLCDLQQELKLTYLFISHDLSVVKYISDRVCVMFLGRICEIGSTNDVYSSPLHPYTRFLLDSVPKPDPKLRRDDKELLTGDIPSPLNPPSGCRFHTRCPYAQQICKEMEPELQDYGNARQCACHFPLVEPEGDSYRAAVPSPETTSYPA